MEELIDTCAVDGVVARKDLVAAGATRAQLKAAEDGGLLVRLGRCRYATADADEGVVTAVAAGGTLTCLSALERLGVWTLDVGPDHHVRRAARRRRDGPVVGGDRVPLHPLPPPEPGGLAGRRPRGGRAEPLGGGRDRGARPCSQRAVADPLGF